MSTKQQILALATCVIMDCLSFVNAREVLKDFLHGAIGKWKAKKTWRQFSKTDKVILNSLKLYIHEDAVLFRRYYFLYHLFIYSLVPMYIAFLSVLLLSGSSSLCNIMILIRLVISFLFLLVFRFPRLPHVRTRFVHYHNGHFRRSTKSKK